MHRDQVSHSRKKSDLGKPLTFRCTLGGLRNCGLPLSGDLLELWLTSPDLGGESASLSLFLARLGPGERDVDATGSRLLLTGVTGESLRLWGLSDLPLLSNPKSLAWS